MILFGSLVLTIGFGVALVSSRKRVILGQDKRHNLFFSPLQMLYVFVLHRL